MSNQSLNKLSGKDCTLEFKKAYENRYTWSTLFKGYQGECIWISKGQTEKGSFSINSDFKSQVLGIKDPNIVKSISSQLWEVCIHRVRRPFDQVHGENKFVAGNVNDVGLEVLVEGKNKGDKYRIKDSVVRMVYRNIHGKIVNIFTEDIINTGHGYLSKTYTSEYIDPKSGMPCSPKQSFTDSFQLIFEDGPWLLNKRSIYTQPFEGQQTSKQEFIFQELKII